MAFREMPVDGDGTGEVGVVIGVARGDIEQEEVSVPAGLVIFDIVEDAGIGAGGDDGVVGEGGSLANELMGELGFDFVFEHAGFDESAHAFEAIAGDGAGTLEEFDLGGLFDDTKPVHQPRESVVMMKGVPFLDPSDEAGLPGFDHDFGAFVLVGIEPDMFGLAHEAVEELREFGNPLDIANARGFASAIFVEFPALPGGDQFGGFPEKKDFPLAFIVCIWEQQQNRFLLFHPGEMEEVGVRGESKGPVGVGGEDVVRIDEHQGAGREELHQSAAVADEELRIDGRMAHGWSVAMWRKKVKR